MILTIQLSGLAVIFGKARLPNSSMRLAKLPAYLGPRSYYANTLAEPRSCAMSKRAI
jgi:hypothetical protein